MQKDLMFFLDVKGKPMTKSTTGDLNVTHQVTALWTVIAYVLLDEPGYWDLYHEQKQDKLMKPSFQCAS